VTADARAGQDQYVTVETIGRRLPSLHCSLHALSCVLEIVTIVMHMHVVALAEEHDA